MLHFPREIVLGPEQIKAINSERRVILIMGEAGTGKTTVLLATLLKYTGKHVPENERKKVVFSIPYHKTTSKNDIVYFIEQFCFREWVEIVLGFDDERVCKNTGSTVYLFDEIYDTHFISRTLMRGKIYAVVIPGEKMTFELKRFHPARSDLELIYLREIYRTPADISNCSVKLKRLLNWKPAKTNSLNDHFIHQDIHWEMSFLNSTPLREESGIEIRSYHSLQMEDLKKSIGQSDLIVTLDFEKEKIQEMDLIFDTNTIFHENSEDKKKNDQISVERIGVVNDETILLICGKNFKKEYLTYQQGLVRYIELKQCVVHVIFDYRVSQEIEQFAFNFGSRYIYEEPDERKASGSLADECQKMHDIIRRSKVREVKINIITFYQTMEAVEIINSIFQKSSVVHMNIQREKSGLENSDHNGGQEINAKSQPKAVKKEIVLIFGHPFWEQLPRQQFSPCFFNLVKGCSLTLISQNISLNDSFWVSSLSGNDIAIISEGLEDSLRKCNEKLPDDLKKIVDESLSQFADWGWGLIFGENLKNLIEQDLVGSLNSIGNLIDEKCTKLFDGYFVELLKSKIEKLFGNSSDRAFSIFPITILCGKKAQLLSVAREMSKKFLKIYEKLNINSAFQNVCFTDEGVRRFFLENWDNFHKNTLVTLVEEQEIWQLSDMDYIMIPWAHRNLHKFREVFWNLLGVESLGTAGDEKFMEWELDRLGEGNLRKLVRRNLKSFEKPVLRSLIAEDFFSIEHLSFRTWEKVNNGNLRRLLIQHICTIADNINMKSSVRINSVDKRLETFISNDLMECDGERLMYRVSKVLGNLELLRTLTDEDERRMFSDKIFREASWRELTDEKLKLLIRNFSELMGDLLKTVFGLRLTWRETPIKICWESATQSNLLRLSPDSFQCNNLLPIFNYSEGNRLILTFGINEKISDSLSGFFSNDTVIHRKEYDNPCCCLLDRVNEEHSCFWSQKANFACDSDSYRSIGNYDYMILVIPRKMNSNPTLLELQMIKPHLGSRDRSQFFCVSDKETYENLITEEFHINGRLFFEILNYLDSSSNEEIIELIPLFKQQTILLAWNVEEEVSQKISETFVQYEVKRVPRTQEEPFCIQIENREINFLILVCGKLEGKTYLSQAILDEITHLRIKCSIYIVCHSINSDHIKSVFLSCNEYNFLEKKLLPDMLQEPIDIGSTIPTIEADIETKVFILTWNVSPNVLRYVGDTFQNCTIRRVEEQSNFLERAYDEVILVCHHPLDVNAIASGLSRFSSYIRSRCNFYLVGDQNYFAEIAAVLPPENGFHFTINFCFFGDSIIDQIGKVPVLKKQRDPNVLLVSLNLDKSTALEIDNKFTSYTTKHIDLMPWSSNSLSFTGSNFNKVVLICNEHTNAHSRQTKSVLYSALTCAKQKAVVFCHEKTESHIRKLLSLSSTDQVFHKIRSRENLGENFPYWLENQYDILEAFKSIIVLKNVAQFNSLENFVSECTGTDPSFDWLFDRIQSMLLHCFPWGHEIVHMLNKFLTWRPASRSEVNIFNSPSFFSGVGSTKEERMKLLEGIEMDLRSTDLAFDTMDTSKLKSLALSAVVWNQTALFDEVFERLRDILSLDDEFFAELLYHAIALNEIEYVEKIVENIAMKESRIFCLLKQTAPFIDEAIFSKLVTSVRIPSDVFLMQNLSEEPFQTLIHYFASTATPQCFMKLLSLLPEKTVKFSAFNLQDDLGRNVLMSAVCNSEVFHLILNRAEQQGDLYVLLSQKDSKGWSCLRHACNADNIDVVKLLVREYSFNYKDDVDSRDVQLMDFVQTLGRNHIKNFLSRL